MPTTALTTTTRLLLVRSGPDPVALRVRSVYVPHKIQANPPHLSVLTDNTSPGYRMLGPSAPQKYAVGSEYIWGLVSSSSAGSADPGPKSLISYICTSHVYMFFLAVSP